VSLLRFSRLHFHSFIPFGIECATGCHLTELQRQVEQPLRKHATNARNVAQSFKNRSPSTRTIAWMSSFITTMFVPLQSSPPAQLLPPHCTLKQSSSCVTINTYSILDSPEPAYCSPSPRAAQRLRDSFSSPVVDPSSPSSNARTRGQFKPQRANKGTTSYQLRQFAEATLGSGSLRKAVKLPEGEDLNEWLAVNGGQYLITDGEELIDHIFQSLIFTIRSTCSTARSQSSVRRNHVLR
jgi:hypothetical protein